MLLPEVSLDISGVRLTAVYRVTGSAAEARSKAEDICLEQSVELPLALLPKGDIRAHVVGRIESIEPVDANHHEAAISFAIESAGRELTQLLNLVFGNTSLKAGVRLVRLDLPDLLLNAYCGPRFGCQGLRDRMGVFGRPVLGVALKPMGLPPADLANLAAEFALGGVDLIKDDHGLGNQPLAPFCERVERCAEAVLSSNRRTGLQSVYAPNITAPADQVLQRALAARAAGAGALLICPGLTGLDAMRQVAGDDRVGLPVISHPALQGSFVGHPDDGIAPSVLFGQLNRLGGADAVIFVNFGGRFSSTRDDCLNAVAGATCAMGRVKGAMPAPAGAMDLSRMAEMLDVYGKDTMLFMVGALYGAATGLAETCREWRKRVERLCLE